MKISSSTLPTFIPRNRWLGYCATIAGITLFIIVIYTQSIHSPGNNIILSFDFIPFHHQQSNEQDQLHCLFNVHQVFQSLNASWFVTFGSALFYHRNRSFNTHDIDTGMFVHDLMPVSNRLLSTFKAHGFRHQSSFGSLENGQEWSFKCPSSNMKIDLFIFYPPLPSDPKSSSFVWWTAMYGGAVCDRKRYRKCRLRFSSIEFEEVGINNIIFRMVPTKFLAEHYGDNWTIPIQYTYQECVPFVFNIIDE